MVGDQGQNDSCSARETRRSNNDQNETGTAGQGTTRTRLDTLQQQKVGESRRKMTYGLAIAEI